MLAQSNSDHLEIEHKEFPRSVDGYDCEAVDRHLRAVAELLERRGEVDASWNLSLALADEVRQIGESAGTRVQEIVAVAERTGGEIVEHAEAQANAIVEHAEGSAETIRRQALEHAAQMGEDAERESQEAHDRARAQAKELRQAMATASTLLERLGSAGALEGELNAVSERIAGEAPPADLGDDSAVGGERPGRPRLSYRGAAAPAGEHDPEQTVEESAAHPLSAWLSKRWLMGQPFPPPASDEHVPDAEEFRSGEAGSRPNHETYTPEKMRVAAFNKLVRGSERDDVAVYLRESFELTADDDDLLEAALDEAAVRTREWRAVPNSIPRGNRFSGG